MNKEMKEKTIEAISRKVQSNDYCGGDCSVCGLECSYAVCGEILYALIEAGMILPKFKIGQEVWYVDDEDKILLSKVYLIRISEYGIGYYLGGNTNIEEQCVFATEAEAQQAIKE